MKSLTLFESAKITITKTTLLPTAMIFVKFGPELNRLLTLTQNLLKHQIASKKVIPLSQNQWKWHQHLTITFLILQIQL